MCVRLLSLRWIGVAHRHGAATAVLTISALVSSLKTLFSFDAPVLSASPSNGPAAPAGSLLALDGLNFGALDLSLTASIGGTPCLTSSWTAASTIACRAPIGAGVARSVVVAPSLSARTFSYDGAVVTALYGAPNSPTAGGASITVAGLRFGDADGSASAAVHTAPCRSSSWSSATAVLCAVPPGVGGAAKSVSLTLHGHGGTLALQFSFDPPRVSAVSPPSAPEAGGSRIVVAGRNLGRADTTLYIGSTACAETIVIAPHSQLGCLVSRGTGAALAISAEADGQLLDTGATFSYVTRHRGGGLRAVYPLTGPTLGGGRITVDGSGFGTDAAAVARVHRPGLYSP